MKTRLQWLLVAALLLLPTCVPVVTPAPTQPPAASQPTTDQPVPPTELPSAPATTPTSDQPLAALVNGQPIYLADYERQVAQYQAAVLVPSGIDLSSEEGQQTLLQARERVLDVMIEQALVEQAAAGMGITVTDEQVDAALAQIINDIGGEESFQERLNQDGMSREDAWDELRAELIGAAVMEAITANLPTTAEYVHARHILVDTREEAERILAQLQAGADFAELARTYSQDENTRDAGGDLGFFPRGVLLSPEVEEAAFSLQPGQISPIIESPFGFHIVQVVERDPNREMSPEDLRWARTQAIEEWREALWAGATIIRYVGQEP